MRSMQYSRTRYVALLAACGLASAALAGEKKLTVSKPTSTADAKLVIKSGDTTFDQTMQIDKDWSAAEKAEFIRARINLANVINEWGWTVTRVGATVKVVTPDKKIEASFDSKATGEEKDKIASLMPADGSGNGRVSFANASFSPSDAFGSTATFTAGVHLNGTDYSLTMSALDSRLGGDLSGENIAAVMYGELLGTVPSALAAMSYSPGDDFFAVDFAPETVGTDVGVIFGTTALTEGVSGFVAVVPEPAAGALLLLGSLVGLRRRG